jgi:hypothetical protein
VNERLGRRAAGLSAVAAAGALLLAGCGGSGSSSASGSASGSGAGSSAASSSTSASASASGAASGASDLKGLSAAQVLAKAKAAFAGASSVHVVFDVKDPNGKAIGYDDRYVKDKGAIGTVDAGAGKIDIILIGSDVYFRGDAKALAGVGARGAAGTWFKTSTTSAAGRGLSGLTDVKSLADSILKPSGSIELVEGKDVDGTPTVGLLDRGNEGGTLYVAAQGEPYPLLVEPPAAQKGQGSVKFSGFGEPVELTPPATSQPLPGT